MIKLSAQPGKLRFPDVSGPNVHWGAAQIGLHDALARNGIASEILKMGDVAEFMAARDRLERARGSGEALAAPVDEAGMLYVDTGQADLVVNFREQVDWAYRGFGHNASYPLKNLRGIARVIQPQYVGIAATEASGITSLEQVAAERRPIRLFTVSRGLNDTRFMGWVISRILQLSGFTQSDVEAWGGQVFTGNDGYGAIVAGTVDLIVIPAYSYWGPPWGSCWMQAQIRSDLRFLPIAKPILEALAAELNLRAGTMPPYLFRGLEQAVPTFVMADHTVSTNAFLPDETAYATVKAIDEHPESLHRIHANFAFNPRIAWRELGIPIHPGAEAYYRERGYMKE